MAKKAPKGLAAGGRTLWNGVVKSFELRPDELRILEDACREADLVDQLEALLRSEHDDSDEELDVDVVAAGTGGLMTAGSMGQIIVAPVVQEIRLHRKVLSDLLSKLKLGDAGAGEAGKSGKQAGPKAADEGSRSSSGRRLATQRWGTRG